MACEEIKVKVAVTDSLPVIVTAQSPVPEQAPDHPVKFEFKLAFADIVTKVLGA